MKIIFSLLFFLILHIHLYAQEEQKNYWDNGSLKSVGQVLPSGLKTGVWKYYYTNGQLEAEGSYNGNSIEKNTNVVRLSKKSALKDKKSARQGSWLFYYSTGQKKAKVNYQGGCPTGLLVKWYSNSEKLEETEYLECKPIGNRKVWDKKGWLKYETRIEGMGKSTEIEWHKNGQKKSSIPYKKGYQYGRVKRWYSNGQKEEDVMMKNTRVHGSYRSWYSNGNKCREFFSINNVMNGLYKEWNKDGALIWEITELTKSKEISVKNYWPNGEVRMQGLSKLPITLSIHQWAQARDGKWIYWNKNNEVLKTENYKDGKLINTEYP